MFLYADVKEHTSIKTCKHADEIVELYGDETVGSNIIIGQDGAIDVRNIPQSITQRMR